MEIFSVTEGVKTLEPLTPIPMKKGEKSDVEKATRILSKFNIFFQGLLAPWMTFHIQRQLLQMQEITLLEDTKEQYWVVEI